MGYSLTSSRGLPPALFKHVFDWIFDTEIYKHWSQGKQNWQLRIVGGPGSGKVQHFWPSPHPGHLLPSTSTPSRSATC